MRDYAAEAAEAIHRRIFDNEPTEHNSYRVFKVLIREIHAPLYEAARRVFEEAQRCEQAGLRTPLTVLAGKLAELLPEVRT